MGIDFHGGHIGLYLGLYEIELNRHLRRLCPPGTKCFDVGGQMGYDAILLAKLSGASVVSVECDAEWCGIIRHNVRANPALEPLVLVHQSFIDRVDDPATGRLTLDTLAAETFTPGFIKLDIEGGEVAALLGADLVLSSMPALLVEVHSAALEQACLELLCSRGYKPVVVGQRTWLPDHRPLEHNRWLVAYPPCVPG